MTETKWPESTTPPLSLTNPLYKIYTANCDKETAITREAKSGQTSLLDFHDIEEHKWSRQDTKSQIDDIWTSYTILLNFTSPILISANEITNSDHKILTTEWNTGINRTLQRPKRSSRKIYLYDRVTDDGWIDFDDEIKRKLDEFNLQLGE
ncbi:hypothetical protein C2G38_2180566 [Gigaspora rosea]|uniref:Endonuclease/exonuclease/phosphatase domain-containing protein n=1 Tax=Gigaspora rosea TaxID=44941 RepID=A0A397VDK3_9GLOM|nr:hypothetical protein C2G38_2180566 [Gigaspora rosea]